MAESVAGAVERVGVGQTEPTRSKPIPEIEARPIGVFQNLIGVGRQLRVGEQNCRLLLVMAVKEAQPPGNRCAGFVEPPIELRARRSAVIGERFGRRIIRRPLVRPDTKVEMRHAKGHRQVAVEHTDMGRRVWRSNLPGSALDQRPERDFVPMPLEEITQQLLQTGLVCRQRKDFNA